MKNVVFVIADMDMGGAQRVVSLLAARIMEQSGFHVDIVTMNRHTRDGFFPIPASVGLHSLATAGFSAHAASAVFSNIRRIRLLRRMLVKLKPDCVISFQTETNIVCLLAMAGKKIPVIISERSDPHIHPQANVWRAIRRLVYPLAHGAVFQTSHAARFFDKVVRNKIVIFNPVSSDADMSASVPAAPYILGVGRLSPEKGFDDLVSAHALARQACPDLKLVLVGEGPERSALEARADQLGTRPHVIFAGAQDKLAAYYASALAFVLPSRFEGLPNALLEAMAQGCTVISTPLFAAAAEVITHEQDGLIAANGTPQALADEITDIYGNLERGSEIGERARQSAVRFEGGRICSAWIDYINTHIP